MPNEPIMPDPDLKNLYDQLAGQAKCLQEQYNGLSQQRNNLTQQIEELERMLEALNAALQSAAQYFPTPAGGELHSTSYRDPTVSHPSGSHYVS